MKVSLVTVTPDEKYTLLCQRVSNPQNQNNDSFEGLLRYCIKHQHWTSLNKQQ